MRENTKNIVKAVSFALIPLAVCVIYAALQGVMLWEIEPTAVATYNWCDEPYYYIQIESMADVSNPYGFFGYNEKQAEIGSLAAWSVAVLYPYSLMAKYLGGGNTI